MEPALQSVPKPPQPKLVSKLIAAIAEIQLVPKRGHNSFNGYTFATAEDIVQATRGPLLKHGLLVYSTLKERQSDQVQTSQGKPSYRERLVLTVTVTDGESTISVDVPGEGQDSGDKAVYKALTGATKYALRSLLQLPIGDDPEAESHETVRPQPQKPQPPLSVVKPPLTQAPPPPGNGRNGATVGSVPMATVRQLSACHALAKACQIDEDRLKKGLKDGWGVERLEELNRRQASELLDLLKTESKRYPPVSQVHER